ncbi:hypothetical protein ACI7BZ_12970 [Xanthobacter sp. AM11]|uniref:hypothetical protein n=1 Tax=Xanthobacter sp. AM11 TaxID=3380643 RepID=UPI0039BF39EB
MPRIRGFSSRQRRGVAALLLALLPGAIPAAAQQAVTLPYFNAPAEGAPIRRPPTLGLAIGGAVHRAVMDTGSTGVVIAASSIPGFAALEPLGTGQITYTSSGRVMRGVHVRTPVTVVGADGTRLTTRPIVVLAVTRIDCLATARNCVPVEAPRRVAMLGIGFARSRHAGTGPERNPFLNPAGMEQAGRGYVVGRRAVKVGLSPDDKAGFSLVKLQPDAATGDFAPTPACLALDQRTPPACGSLLMDTGVTTMFLSLPDAQTSGLLARDRRGEPVLAAGTTLAVSPSEGASTPAYGFTVGDRANPVAPERVIVVGGGTRPPFVNTTVRALNAFDYLFDADAGEVGFRPLSAIRP